MIILKATNETLQATTGPGTAAPTRKGYVNSIGSGGVITVTPNGSISDGDWMVLNITTYVGITFTDPTGWTILYPQTTVNTLVTAIYGKIRVTGETSYSVTLSAGSTASDGTLMWGSGADVPTNWVIGTSSTRATISPVTSTDTIAPALTTTTDHTLVLALFGERTTADEGDIVSFSGAQKWFFIAQKGADIETTVVGVFRDVSPAGITNDVRASYPVAQPSNGVGIQIGIPPTRVVSIDSSLTYVEETTTGATYSTYETKIQNSVGATLFANEKPINDNTPADTSQVELGVNFTTYVSGTVTAIRYYKGVGSGTGTKVGHLWTTGGTLLATVTFVNETASGWQTQALSPAVAVTAGNDYVVSYYAPNGNYANSPGYFISTKYVGPLAIAAFSNGRYSYGPSGTFPSSYFNNTNYFTDIIMVSDPLTATTTALDQPTGTNIRIVKLLSFVNSGTTGNTVSLLKTIISSSYRLTPTVLLGPGEMLEYADKVGWKLYASDGRIKANFGLPTSSTSQLVFNNKGAITSSPDLVWQAAQDTLMLGGTNKPSVRLSAVNPTPAAPSAANLGVFSQRAGGKIHLMKQGPVGEYGALQASLWQNNTVMWTPATNSGVWTGATGVNIGTAVQSSPTNGNEYTQMRRSTFATTSGNTQAGLRSEGMFYLSTDPAIGGFFLVCRFGFESIKSGGRAFVGMVPSTTTNITTVDPSSLVNICGFGFDSGDSTWSFMHNNASGIAIKESIPGQGILATSNTGYDAYIWNIPGSNTIYYRFNRTDTGVTLVEGSVASTVPVSSTQLMAVAHCGNGTNPLAGDLTMGVNRIYIETNR